MLRPHGLTCAGAWLSRIGLCSVHEDTTQASPRFDTSPTMMSVAFLHAYRWQVGVDSSMRHASLGEDDGVAKQMLAKVNPDHRHSVEVNDLGWQLRLDRRAIEDCCN